MVAVLTNSVVEKKAAAAGVVEAAAMAALAGDFRTENTERMGSTWELEEAVSSLNFAALGAGAGARAQVEAAGTRTPAAAEEVEAGTSTAGGGPAAEEEGVDSWDVRSHRGDSRN